MIVLDEQLGDEGRRIEVRLAEERWVEGRRRSPLGGKEPFGAKEA